jgi:hypothetical protein
MRLSRIAMPMPEKPLPIIAIRISARWGEGMGSTLQRIVEVCKLSDAE